MGCSVSNIFMKWASVQCSVVDYCFQRPSGVQSHQWIVNPFKKSVTILGDENGVYQPLPVSFSNVKLWKIEFSVQKGFGGSTDCQHIHLVFPATYHNEVWTNFLHSSYSGKSACYLFGLLFHSKNTFRAENVQCLSLVQRFYFVFNSDRFNSALAIPCCSQKPDRSFGK